MSTGCGIARAAAERIVAAMAERRDVVADISLSRIE